MACHLDGVGCEGLARLPALGGGRHHLRRQTSVAQLGWHPLIQPLPAAQRPAGVILGPRSCSAAV